MQSRGQKSRRRERVEPATARERIEPVYNALAAATPREATPLVGPGFRSTARLAGASIPMMMDILETNRSNVLEALGEFRHALDALVTSLEAADLEALQQQLAQGADRYQALLKT